MTASPATFTGQQAAQPVPPDQQAAQPVPADQQAADQQAPRSAPQGAVAFEKRADQVVIKCEKAILVCAIAYVGLAGASLAIAHGALALGYSAVGERMIHPAVRALTFLDAHWKAALLAMSPLLLRNVAALLPRIKKAGKKGVEFFPAAAVMAAPKKKKLGTT